MHSGPINRRSYAAQLTHEAKRKRRLQLRLDVASYLRRSFRIVWFQESTLDPRIFVGQLVNGSAFAILVKLPAEPIAESSRHFLANVSNNGGVAFAVGQLQEVEIWLNKLRP